MIFPNGTVVEIPGMVDSLPGAKKQTVKDDGEGTIEQSPDKAATLLKPPRSRSLRGPRLAPLPAWAAATLLQEGWLASARVWPPWGSFRCLRVAPMSKSPTAAR